MRATGSSSATASWPTRQAPVDGVDLLIRTTRGALPGLLAGQTAGTAVEGDTSVLARLVSLLEAPHPDFAIVTPWAASRADRRGPVAGAPSDLDQSG